MTGRTDGRQTVTLRFPLDPAKVKSVYRPTQQRLPYEIYMTEMCEITKQLFIGEILSKIVAKSWKRISIAPRKAQCVS